MKVTGRQVKSNSDYPVSYPLYNLSFSIEIFESSGDCGLPIQDWDLTLLELKKRTR